MKVYLLGFRGLGFSAKDESALIRAGHVGWQLEGDERIFGFHPTDAAIAAVGGEGAALRILKDEHDTLEGTVQIDTAIFERAVELSEIGERTIVRRYLVELSEGEFERVKLQTETWYTEQKIFAYSFPPEELMPDRDNCATFPRRLGLPLLDPVGQMRNYVVVLEEKGEIWTPKGS